MRYKIAADLSPCFAHGVPDGCQRDVIIWAGHDDYVPNGGITQDAIVGEQSHIHVRDGSRIVRRVGEIDLGIEGQGVVGGVGNLQ